MRYRAIRPIHGKIELMPGNFVPSDVSKSWIKKKLKENKIAIYHGKKEDEWQQEEPLAQNTQEPI